MKSKFIKTAVVLAVLWGLLGCSPKIVPVTGSTDTQVNIKDSTVYNIIDSVRITEATHYKDIAWLGDSLKIEGNHSRMWAVADTAKEALIGGLEEDEVKEKTKIIYKDRWKVRDSIRVEEKPVPYEVEKIVYKTPLVVKILAWIGGAALFLLALGLILKFGIKKI